MGEESFASDLRSIAVNAACKVTAQSLIEIFYRRGTQRSGTEKILRISTVSTSLWWGHVCHFFAADLSLTSFILTDFRADLLFPGFFIFVADFVI